MSKRDLTIERSVFDDGDETRGYDVYEHGVYEQSSVLAGQAKRSFRDHFETLAEAKAAYPSASESGSTRAHSGTLSDMSGLPAMAPDWFDPQAAGESWDEDY